MLAVSLESLTRQLSAGHLEPQLALARLEELSAELARWRTRVNELEPPPTSPEREVWECWAAALEGQETVLQRFAQSLQHPETLPTFVQEARHHEAAIESCRREYQELLEDAL